MARGSGDARAASKIPCHGDAPRELQQRARQATHTHHAPTCPLLCPWLARPHRQAIAASAWWASAPPRPPTWWARRVRPPPTVSAARAVLERGPTRSAATTTTPSTLWTLSASATGLPCTSSTPPAPPTVPQLLCRDRSRAAAKLTRPLRSRGGASGPGGAAAWCGQQKQPSSSGRRPAPPEAACAPSAVRPNSLRRQLLPTAQTRTDRAGW